MKSSPHLIEIRSYFTNLILLVLLWREYAPESQGLIASAGHQCLAVRAHGQIQYAERVSCQHGKLAHSRLLPPNDYLVLAIAMRANQLVDVFRKG